ncbi:BTAD domain-containing putative transcriptional regulator [Streptomyces sp. NPDC060027]|uniref:AfsR/SARP family transcriptional regulator n=1 Tax=Streptomyces sp. NPDC060027 TaxID=3347040 RepID=UPI0036C9FD96
MVSIGDGYALRTEETAGDLDEFEEGLTQAEARRAAGDIRGAVRLLSAAPALWHGTALAGVPGPYAETERTRTASSTRSAPTVCGWPGRS